METEDRVPAADAESLDDFNPDEDICRVCRLSGEGTLYYPCRCSGSIKYVHQECLLQWLTYSKKTVCELCNHPFAFQPVYAEDMPERLPFADLLNGLLMMCTRFTRAVLMHTLVAACWFVFVPLVVCRVHKMVFAGIFHSFLSLKVLNAFSTDNLMADICTGMLMLSLFLVSSIALIWLREQVQNGGPPEMLTLPQREEAAAAPAAENDAVVRDGQDAAADAEQRNDVGDDEQAEPAEDNAPVQPHHELIEVAAAAQEQNVERFVVDDMTWQRILGLDGSFAFLENVFWAISLNFVFNVVFLYAPAVCGDSVLSQLGLRESIYYFETVISIFVGYCVTVFVLFTLHCVARVVNWLALYRSAAVFYLCFKVFLLVTIELVIFPLLCGWWLDVCSLSLTGQRLEDRLMAFRAYPTSSMVLHWLAGMLYVFYSASFILALRELLRPGVLWFIRNFNDPDFSPVGEMITQPVLRHCRRLIASTSLFLSIIFFVVKCPLSIISLLVPGVLPYTLSASDVQVGGFALELMLLQVVLPAALEYIKAYAIFEFLVKKWCIYVGGRLQLDAYLLSSKDRVPTAAADEQPQANANIPAEDVRHGAAAEDAQPAAEAADEAAPVAANNDDEAAQAADAHGDDLAARHHAMLMMREPQDAEHYERPPNFHARLCALVLCVAITLILGSAVALVVPVCIGRVLIGVLVAHTGAVHEIYTASAGFGVCWLIGKAWLTFRDWFNRGWNYMNVAVRRACIFILKIAVAAIPTFGIIPLLLSFYLQLLIIGPLRVSIGQTPIFFVWKEIALGILHLKIICATVLMGPDWWLKTLLEQTYEDGIRGMRLRRLYIELVLPTISTLSVAIAAPYVIVRTALFACDLPAEENALLVRWAYPALLLLVLTIAYVRWQWQKLCALAQKIRDEKWRVGTQLVNFYRDSQSTLAPAAEARE